MSCSRTRRRTSWGVGDHTAAKLFHAAQHAADRPPQFRRLTKSPCPLVTVMKAPEGKIRGPAMIPEVTAPLQSEYGATHVADRGEAAHQRGCRLYPRRDIVVSGVTSDRLSRIGPYQHRMPVCVDQARHQRSPVPGDYGYAWLGGDRHRRDAFNDVALNEHA